MPQVTNGTIRSIRIRAASPWIPTAPTTLVVTSFDRYNFDDDIWRTTNANASSPSWTTLYQLPRQHLCGYNPTRNTTNAPYMASSGDGIGNWASDVAIDPFNSAQIMHTYGGGIWATNQGTSTTTLTAANSWYFPDTGIEMTAVLGMAATTGGTPLYGAMGDVGGFAFTTLAFSPTQGNIYANGGNGTSVDSAGLDPQDAALVGNMGTTYGFYTTNGTTFSPSPPIPAEAAASATAPSPMSANGSTIVWAPSGQAAYYSTNDGASWTLATLVGGGAASHRRCHPLRQSQSQLFLLLDRKLQRQLLDALHQLAMAAKPSRLPPVDRSAPETDTGAVNPTVAGQFGSPPMSALYESTNFGASFSHPISYSTNVSSLAVGAAGAGKLLSRHLYLRHARRRLIRGHLPLG